MLRNLLKITTGDDAIDEIEDTPLEAIDMLTNETDALRKFIQGAVLPLGIEVDVKAGLKITAGHRTMSGHLTGQVFYLPVMLTGHN